MHMYIFSHFPINVKDVVKALLVTFVPLQNLLHFVSEKGFQKEKVQSNSFMLGREHSMTFGVCNEAVGSDDHIGNFLTFPSAQD